MAHEPVEVVRARGPGIDLLIDNLWLLAEILSQCLAEKLAFSRRGFHSIEYRGY
jgi:hypothetical protein